MLFWWNGSLPYVSLKFTPITPISWIQDAFLLDICILLQSLQARQSLEFGLTGINFMGQNGASTNGLASKKKNEITT